MVFEYCLSWEHNDLFVDVCVWNSNTTCNKSRVQAAKQADQNGPGWIKIFVNSSVGWDLQTVVLPNVLEKSQIENIASARFENFCLINQIQCLRIFQEDRK